VRRALYCRPRAIPRSNRLKAPWREVDWKTELAYELLIGVANYAAKKRARFYPWRSGCTQSLSFIVLALRHIWAFCRFDRMRPRDGPTRRICAKQRIHPLPHGVT